MMLCLKFKYVFVIEGQDYIIFKIIMIVENWIIGKIKVGDILWFYMFL